MSAFDELAHRDAFDVGMELATYGANAHSRATPRRPPQEHYPSVRDDPLTTIEHMWPEVLE